jgi:Iron-containing redox enzyme
MSHESEPIPTEGRYSAQATELINILDARVDDVYSEVRTQPFWLALQDSKTPNGTLQAIFREVFLAIYWYQKHTTEAGFHMLGRLPGSEEKLLKLLMLHKIEEAGHNEWAFRDYQLLGGSVEFANSTPMQPACYAITGVWWRMAITENPFGYLGAEYLFEYLTMRIAQDLVPLFKKRGFKAEGLKFIIDHATEDEKHAILIRHLISDCVTRYPETEAVMIRCFDYFRQVYPLPVWQEAYNRAIRK